MPGRQDPMSFLAKFEVGRKRVNFESDTCATCLRLHHTRLFQPAFIMLRRAMKEHLFRPKALYRHGIQRRRLALHLSGDIAITKEDALLLERASGMHIRTGLFVNEKQQLFDWWTLHRHEFADRLPPHPQAVLSLELTERRLASG